MGQKVNPVAFRTGVTRGWASRWYASKKDFSELLMEDFKVRNFIKNHPKRTQYKSAGIDRIEIERTRDEVRVIMHVARPGLIIGKKGQEVELLQEELQNLIGRRVNLKTKGIKIQMAGRLGGAEMARREKASSGSIPLSTLQAKIDYGFAEAMTAQGHIGIQVWINQGTYGDDNDGADAAAGQASKKPKRSYKR